MDSRDSTFIHNIETFSNYIKEEPHIKINPDWVLWMLKSIAICSIANKKFNPEWLRASHKLPNDDEPDYS